MVHERVNRDIWPRDLRAASALMGGRFQSVFVRWLHHVKVVYRPGQPLEAKAYLAVKHYWFQQEAVRELVKARDAAMGNPEEAVLCS